MLQTRASYDGAVLSAELPSGTAAGEPAATGEAWSVDYWGRTAVVEPLEGPWAAAYAAHLGRDVVLAASGPGQVVFGGSVSLVTSSPLAALTAELGATVHDTRFRATLTLDTGDLPAFAEEGWVGRRSRLGAAEVEVRGCVPRCAVIDLEPTSSRRDLAVMKALPRLRGRHGDVAFGVDAVVTVPGVVCAGDLATLG